MVEVVIWIKDLVNGGIGQRWTWVSIWLCLFLLTFTSGSSGFLACAWAEEVSRWALLVLAVVACFVAVNALEMVAVTESCNCMLPGAVLVMLL